MSNSNDNISENNNQENQNSVNNEDKYYIDNYSMNVTYEEFETFSNTRMREGELTISQQNLTDNNQTNRRNNNINENITNNVNNTNNVINYTNSQQLNSQNIRENSIAEVSNLYFNNLFEINPLENNEEITGRNFDTDLDDIFQNLTYLINTEKTTLRSERTGLQKMKQKFNEFRMNELNKLEKEKELWKENLKIVESSKCKETDILDLDIGGTHKISTTRNTLTKYPNSALSVMFSGRHEIQKHNGRLFIDRQGESFINMINYLRNGKYPVFRDKNEEVNFFEELNFWQIPIYESINNIKINLQFDPDWCADTLKIEQNNTIIKKQSPQHGIVFCKNFLDINSPFIEFKVNMNIPCRGKSHLFVGLVDKSKYKTENLLSTFWKDSPSSFYWDVWNTKLIKTDENGVQIGSIIGYGCQCEEYETSLGMIYDYKSRSVSFYKNGIFQGIAFRNVPSGLTPSIDVWFESGSIEITQNNSFKEKLFL